MGSAISDPLNTHINNYNKKVIVTILEVCRVSSHSARKLLVRGKPSSLFNMVLLKCYVYFIDNYRVAILNRVMGMQYDN